MYISPINLYCHRKTYAKDFSLILHSWKISHLPCFYTLTPPSLPDLSYLIIFQLSTLVTSVEVSVSLKVSVGNATTITRFVVYENVGILSLGPQPPQPKWLMDFCFGDKWSQALDICIFQCYRKLFLFCRFFKFFFVFCGGFQA